ncbi:MAG: shikimate dehydrogenase, partial [Sedimenticola sp.]|nr:shikimate dehydrogenase [Sedimenticola sp.]
MTDRYAVIGNPIEHSQSPRIHRAFAEQTVEDLNYTRLLGSPDHFEEEVRQFFANGGRGLNVTVPFKERAWAMVDERSPRAGSAGAVNTLIPLENGRLRGDNTDGAGLVRDLAVNHGYLLSGSRILLLGAGGASKGVLRPLLEGGPERLVVANRTAEKARRLADSLKAAGPVSGCGLDELEGERFDLIINGTAAGLKGELPA